MPHRPDAPRTLDLAVVVAGTTLWAAAFVVLLFLRETLRRDGRLWWLGTCATGVGLGLVGIGYLRRRAARIARAEAADPGGSSPPPSGWSRPRRQPSPPPSG